MSEHNSAVSLLDSPLVSRSPFDATSADRTTDGLRFGVIAALVVTAIALLPGDASAQERRACRATGYFQFTLNEYAAGSVTTRTARVNVLQSDMEVVATSAGQTWGSVTDAKRWACEQAANCYVELAKGEESCGPSVLNAVYETIKRPDNMEAWRRQVACYHARAGSIPGLRQTSTNKVTVVQTKIVATGSRDGITRNSDATVDESDYVCWSPAPTDPAPAPPGPRPSRPTPDPPPTGTDPDRQPSRTDSSHLPSRTDDSHRPSRTNAPSPIESIKVTVTPPEQKGKCPTSVLMQARLELSRPVEVRWWVTGEDGYQSPKYIRSLTTRDASLIWRRHIDPKPDTSRLTQKSGSTSRAPVHQGYFQVHFETVSQQERGLPLGESDRVSFAVDCNPPSSSRLKRQ